MILNLTYQITAVVLLRGLHFLDFDSFGAKIICQNYTYQKVLFLEFPMKTG